MFVVVIDKPHNVQVRFEVDAAIVQCGDTGELNRGTVGLYYTSAQISLEIVDKVDDRDLFIGVIACKVDTYERYELDLRVFAEGALKVCRVMCFRRQQVQKIRVNSKVHHGGCPFHL